MRKPIGFWSETLRRLGLKPTSAPRPSRRATERRARFESLENRSLMATVDVGISTPSVTEGATAYFTINVTSAGGQDVVVQYTTSSGSATGGSDYSATYGTVTLSAGASATVSVATFDDSADEDNETFSLTITSSNASVATGSAVATILDNDSSSAAPLPAVSISDASLTEGHSGTTSMNFTVTLTSAASQSVVIGYQTFDGTATAGSDYNAVSGSLTFSPGVTVGTISVPIVGDTNYEDNETFSVHLTGAATSSAALSVSDAYGIGTINNDDSSISPLPGVSISDASLTEGHSGTTSMNFTVTLTSAASQSVVIGYQTFDGTATAGSDYNAVSGSLTFSPGVTVGTISVPIVGDTNYEDNETFSVHLTGAATSSAALSISDAYGIGTINNDDSSPSVSIQGTTTVVEGSVASLTVTLSESAGVGVLVFYQTTTGTAGMADFSSSFGSVSFAPGETVKTLQIATYDDSIDEDDETFSVRLISSSMSHLGTSVATLTILDNDNSPSLSIASAGSVSEGDIATFELTLSSVSERAVTVSFQTAGGSAQSPADFVAKTGSVVFAPGQKSQIFDIETLDDDLNDPSESFSVLLSAVNAQLSTSTISVSILDNLPPVAVADTYQVLRESETSISQERGVLNNDSDPDGDTLIPVLENGPSWAVSFSLNPDGSFEYEPIAGTLTDSFTYKVEDPSGSYSSIVTVTLNVVDILIDIRTDDNLQPGFFAVSENSTTLSQVSKFDVKVTTAPGVSLLGLEIKLNVVGSAWADQGRTTALPSSWTVPVDAGYNSFSYAFFADTNGEVVDLETSAELWATADNPYLDPGAFGFATVKKQMELNRIITSSVGRSVEEEVKSALSSAADPWSRQLAQTIDDFRADMERIGGGNNIPAYREALARLELTKAQLLAMPDAVILPLAETARSRTEQAFDFVLPKSTETITLIEKLKIALARQESWEADIEFHFNDPALIINDDFLDALESTFENGTDDVLDYAKDNIGQIVDRVVVVNRFNVPTLPEFEITVGVKDFTKDLGHPENFKYLAGIKLKNSLEIYAVYYKDPVTGQESLKTFTVFPW